MSTTSIRYFLYELIDSLTATEKRYFKIMSKRHVLGETNNYIELFDIICKNKHTDMPQREVQIKTRFLEQTKKVRFDLYKFNLYKKLLETLEIYHKEKDVTAHIKSMIAQIAILRRKDLAAQVAQLIAKAKKQCLKYEKWGLLLEIVEMERDFNYAHQRPSIENNEERSIVQKLTNVCDYRSLQSKMWKLYIEKGLPTNDNIVKQYDELSESGLIQDESAAITLESQFIRLYLLQFYSGMKAKLDDTCKYGEALVSFLENEPHLLQEKGVLYIRSIVNLLLAYTRQKKLVKLLMYIEKCSKATSNLQLPLAFKISTKITLFIIEYDARQLLDKNLDQRELIDKLNDFIRKKESTLSVVLLDLYYWQNVKYHFIHQNYNRCLDWLNEITNSKNIYRSDLKAMSNMLILIVHYELDNGRLLQYACINTYRSLTKKKNLDALENTLLYFLKTELSKSNRTKQQREGSFIRLRKDLAYIKEHEQSHEALKLGMVYDWVVGQVGN